MKIGQLTKQLKTLVDEPELVDKQQPYRAKKAQVLSIQPSQDSEGIGKFVSVDVTTNEVIIGGEQVSKLSHHQSLM